jgi:transcription termination factor Rho
MPGVLELVGRNGFLRRREAGYLPDRSDVHVGERVIRQFELRPGDEVEGDSRPGGKGRSATLERVTSILGRPPADLRPRPDFGRLGAILQGVPSCPRPWQNSCFGPNRGPKILQLSIDPCPRSTP